jgi:hypothetical protein
MLGEKSLNKYARAGEIYDGTLGPDSALFTTTQLRLKSQSILLNHATDHRSLSLTPELSHYIRSCMGLSCMLKVPSLQHTPQSAARPLCPSSNQRISRVCPKVPAYHNVILAVI